MRHHVWFRRSSALAATVGLAAAGGVVGAAVLPAQGQGRAAPRVPRSVFTARAFASGSRIMHATPKGREAISQPDDITFLAGAIYVGFQNGVGPQGQASPTGNHDSTVVEFSAAGRTVRTWDLVGKCDGLTADPSTGRVIATVNEDAHSSLYLINPRGDAAHYRYSKPLPSKGGTDAISIYHHRVLISASAPGTTGAAPPRPTYPAVYSAKFNAAAHLVTMTPMFYDESRATIVNVGQDKGKQVRLALVDADSNEVVPSFAPRFAGDFMLTSQGDQEQIFVSDLGGPRQTLSALSLSASVDDTAWPSDRKGALYASDNDNNTIYRITGPFTRGSVLVADTPCDQNDAPATCPRPNFPPNFLGLLSPYTGVITRVDLSGPAVQPQGLLFRP
jgi:hypothetical protein